MFFLQAFLILLAVAMPLTARAEREAWDGRVRLDAFSSNRNLDDLQGAASTEVALGYQQAISDVSRFRLGGSLYYDFREHHHLSHVEETYWQQEGEFISLLRLGWQKISWGKADGINPGNFFTPHNYRILQPFEEDQNRTIPALRTDISLSAEQTLSLVAEPYFIANSQPFLRGIQVVEQKPDGFRNPQFGVQWARAGKNIDWSLSAFKGYSLVPSWQLKGYNLYSHYAKITGFSADVSGNVDRWGFRAETAWIQPNSQGFDGFRPALFSVVGVDRDIDSWNINVQLINRYTPNRREQDSADENSYSRLVALQNAINFGQQHTTQFGFTGRLSNSWLNQTLQGEIFAIGYVNPGSFMTRASLTYSINDNDQIAFGGEYYGGGDDSFFGQLRKNRTLFAVFRHYFSG